MSEVAAAGQALRLSAPETVEYERLFKIADADADGCIGIQDAEVFYPCSDLPIESIEQVWDLSDTKRRGFLDRQDFYLSLRLVSLAQQGSNISLENAFDSGGVPLPKFSSLSDGLGKSNVWDGNYEVQVLNPRTVKESKIKEYVLYDVVTKFPQGGSNTVTRRFNQFDWLRSTLLESNPGVIVPPLPEKKFWGRFNSDFVEVRRRGLEEFLQSVTTNPVLRTARLLKVFLEATDEALEDVKNNVAGNKGGDDKDVVQRVRRMTFKAQEKLLDKKDIPDLETDTNFFAMKGYVGRTKEALTQGVAGSSKVIALKREVANGHSTAANAMQLLAHGDPDTEFESIVASFSNALNRHSQLLEGLAERECNGIHEFLKKYDYAQNAIEDVIKKRIEAHEQYRFAYSELESKKEKLKKLETAPGKEAEVSKQKLAVEDLSHKFDQLGNDCNHIASSLKGELKTFRATKTDETKEALRSFVKLQLDSTREELAVWNEMWNELASSSHPSMGGDSL